MRKTLRPWLTLSVFLGLFASVGVRAKPEITPKVMTFNLWVGGENGEHPLEHSFELIRKAAPDIVGLQETMGRGQKEGPPVNKAAELARRLKWYFLDQGNETGIISRFPILSPTPQKWGARIQLPNGKTIMVFNAHFRNSPYQPYQLARIEYHGAPFISTEADAIQAARETRGEQVNDLLSEVRRYLRNHEPVIVMGDFNEPSFQDWTQRAAKAKKCPLKVEFPATKSLVKAGLTDSYRSRFPNEVTHRGNTWTAVAADDDPHERHDRIDFVFYGGRGIKAKSVEIVGEDKKHADIVVTPYPSDHRAVLTTFTLGHTKR